MSDDLLYAWPIRSDPGSTSTEIVLLVTDRVAYLNWSSDHFGLGVLNSRSPDQWVKLLAIAYELKLRR